MEPKDLFKKKAITADSSQFLVGRRELIADIADRLCEDTQSAVIFGPRGVGKTTIAWQVASLLLDTNPLFKRAQLLRFGQGRSFDIIFHKCSPAVKTVGDMLIEIIRGKNDPYSFGYVHSYFIQDVNKITKVNKKFGIDLLKVLNYSESYDSVPSNAVQGSKDMVSTEALKIELFTDLIDEIHASKPRYTTIFIVDEIDRPTHIGDGSPIKDLGHFLKDNQKAQFLFVGIGEDISSIIKDHRSAGRNLSGGDYPAPLLSNEEITEIYDIAVREAHSRLDVSDEFLREVVQYSGGMPWIAQNTGYEAVRAKLRSENALGRKVTLVGDDFPAALRRAMSVYKQDNDLGIKMAILGSPSKIDSTLLNAIWAKPGGIPENDLHAAAAGQERYFHSSLLKLKDAGIIMLGADGLVRFFDDIIRIYARFVLDE